MLYNLPNGKVIELSVEQYLDLTDEEVEYLISINYGESIENPFFGSILERPIIIEMAPPPVVVVICSDPQDEETDRSIDYIPEED